MAAKKSKKSKPAPSKAVNKSEFIRSHSNLSAPEIVKLAKSKGFDLSIQMVYTTLSQYRKQQGKANPSKATKAPTTPVPSTKASQSDESAFAALILRLGTERAQALFESTLAKVQKSIG